MTDKFKKNAEGLIVIGSLIAGIFIVLHYVIPWLRVDIPFFGKLIFASHIGFIIGFSISLILTAITERMNGLLKRPNRVS